MTTASPAALRLAALLAEEGEDLPLDRAAALLAEDEDAEIRASEVVEMLDELADGVDLPETLRLLLPERTAALAAIGRINHHLFEELGFEGDTESYDDPLNSLLHRVIQRRRGLPILLSVLYIEVARRVGLTVRGVGYPGHFLVTPELEGPPLYIDPFHQGALRRAADLEARLIKLVPEAAGSEELRRRFLGPCTTRYVLVRMSNNLRGSYLRRGDALGILRSVDRLILLQPETAEHRRDRGLALLGLRRVEEGAAELRTYLELEPDAPEAGVLREHLARVGAEG